jgi:hypothetical protein
MKLAARSLSALVLCLLPLAAAPAAATTFQMVADPVLADQASAIARVRVADVEPSTLGDRPATDYVVEVERVLKGDLPGSTVVVRVPGGIRPDGVGLKVWGAPQLAEGETALLFLNPADDGTFRILHLMLGAFRQQTVAGRKLALRDLSETRQVGPDGVGAARDEIRDFDRFAEWLADRSAGLAGERDYLVASTGKLGSAVEAYKYMMADDGIPIRWFEFDRGRSIAWRVHQDGQPGMGLDLSVAAFRTALQAWNDDGGSNVLYTYAGTTSAGTGFARPDDVNAILFDDPGDRDADGTFDCGSGGVIAVGGPWFYDTTRTFGGKPFHEAGEADIVTNDGTSCFFQNSQRVAEEVFAHELGHTLGLSHSSTRDALMWPNAHDDGRGARLHTDDRQGIASLYPAGGVTPPDGPKAPTTLTALVLSGTEVKLAWKDNANDETGFRVERKVGSGSFQEIQTLAVNTQELTVTGLTAGTNYTFRVRASGASAFSAYSNTVSAKTPAATALPAPAGLTALPRSGTEVLLTWRDMSTGETGFRIERSTGGGAWQEVGSAAANATSALVRGLTSGTAYSFRVRAAGNSGFSAYAGAATASTQQAAEPACATTGPAVCLAGGRFQVEVDWRTSTGSGRGTLVRRSDKSATVWFFEPSNVELIVKVLDGRSLNNAYWVFSSALSDVEYWIKVTDRQTGQVKVWYNRQGQVRGLAATDAFPASGGTAAASVTAVQELAPAPPKPEVTQTTGAAGSCANGANALCLANRFRVEVRWKSNTGATGMAGALPDSANTGLLWFFDPANVEMVVKVLDGRSVNGKFWVFFGALSDVESWVRVTDTQTGQVREYHNLPGKLSNLADTAAF